MKIASFKSTSLLVIGAISCSLIATGCSSSSKKKLTPDEHARLLVEYANAALTDGDPTGALQVLAQAEQEGPNLPELHHTKALCLYVKHDTPGALAEAKRAVELKPDYPDALNTLGKLYMEAGRPQDARAPLSAAAKNTLYRDAYKAETNLGILEYRAGNFAEAGTHFARATESSPNEACIAYYYQGHLSLRDSRFKDAIRQYDHATRRMCGSFTDAQLALGIAYQRNGELDKARKKFLEIQKNFPDSKVAEQASRQLRAIP